MALKRIGKTTSKKKENPKVDNIKKVELSGDELKFILAKLKEANYKGIEFEMFYAIWQRLSSHL